MRTWHAPLDSRRADRKITLRLFGFVLVSIVLHSVVLLSQHASFELTKAGDSTMQVILGSNTSIEAPITPGQIEKKTFKQTSSTAKLAVQKKNIVPTPKSVEQQPVTATADKQVEQDITTAKPQEKTTAYNHTAVATAQTQSVEQQRITLKQRLKQALAKHFYYPMLARKRGWQGQVLLAFSLDTHGTIINARIEQGSGYSALDHAALRSLNKVATIDIGLSQALSFELPVIYNLNGG